MTRPILIALAFMIYCATAVDARAERACCVSKQPSWYLGIGGGLVFLDDTDLEESAPTGLTQGVTHDFGFSVSGQVGYRVLSNARVELEGLYFKNKVDRFVGGSLTPGGSSKATAVMANGYMDFLQSFEVNPYIGAGIGAANLEVPIIRTVGGETHSLEDQWVMAYQFMAGANFPVPETPFYFSIGYRYFTTQDAQVDYDTVGYDVKFNHTSHNIELGGKIYF